MTDPISKEKVQKNLVSIYKFKFTNCALKIKKKRQEAMESFNQTKGMFFFSLQLTGNGAW